jgi:hypothetical protein
VKAPAAGPLWRADTAPRSIDLAAAATVIVLVNMA